MVDSGSPAWAKGSRQFVPSHLTPGTNRSSFAKPSEHGSFRPTAATYAPFRSGPAASEKSNNSVSKPTENAADLPPTESLSLARHTTRGDEAQDSFNLTIATTPATPSKQSHERGFGVKVFGFPPGQTQQVLQHFARFGEIVDNRPHSGGTPRNNDGDSLSDVSRPFIPHNIVCGRNWLHIMYKDRKSAQLALAENGHIMPGHFVVGVLPVEPLEGAFYQNSTNYLLLDDSDASLVDASYDQSLLSESLGPSVSHIPVTKPPQPLFKRRASNSKLPTLYGPVTKEEPKSWGGWAAQKAREFIFGWDDL